MSPAPVETSPDVGVAHGIRKPLPAGLFIEHGTNAEMRWESASEQRFATSNDRFFVRNHTRTPAIDAATYQLKLHGDGLDGAPSRHDAVTFTLPELEALPSHSITAFLECTGNGRALFGAQQSMEVPGTPWLLGGIGMATWQGVRLSELLRLAGLSPEAASVLAVGLDDPYVIDGVDHGPVRRPVPIAKALDDCLLVTHMNGQPLPPDHGHPLRLFVPGWVGVASIKWLGELEVSTTRLDSPWTTTWYRMSGGDYPPDSPPLAEVPVRSGFELPWNATVAVGQPVALSGRSWSGSAPVEWVDVSFDGGETWQSPPLTRHGGAHGWVRWEISWIPSERGSQELLARATDKLGRTQPDEVPYNAEGYLFWAVVRHPVSVV